MHGRLGTVPHLRRTRYDKMEGAAVQGPAVVEKLWEPIGPLPGGPKSAPAGGCPDCTGSPAGLLAQAHVRTGALCRLPLGSVAAAPSSSLWLLCRSVLTGSVSPALAGPA